MSSFPAHFYTLIFSDYHIRKNIVPDYLDELQYGDDGDIPDHHYHLTSLEKNLLSFPKTISVEIDNVSSEPNFVNSLFIDCKRESWTQ